VLRPFTEREVVVEGEVTSVTARSEPGHLAGSKARVPVATPEIRVN